MAYIFISHSSKDNQKAKEIFERLQTISKSIFLDFDYKYGLKGGQKWEKELYKRVKRTRIMIVAISPNWFDSKWCYKEFCLARAYKKIIIPVIIEYDERIKKWDGKDLQHFDLVNDKESEKKLFLRIEELTKDEIARIYDIKEYSSPYPGLRSFEKEEAAFFYGRNEDIIAAVDELNAMSDLAHKKFLNIVGASGVGKSSFMKAGILPYLEFLHSNRWTILDTFRANEDILTNLALIISNITDLKVSSIKEELEKRNFKKIVDRFELLLYDKLKEEQKDIANIKFLFPIDQAEEILNSSNKEEKEIFFEFLKYILTKKDNFFLIWTLRSDQLKKYQDEKSLEFLRDLSQDFILNPISISQIETIIKEPLYQVEDNLKIDKEVIEQIKQDIKSTTSLPLLAYLLQQLYNYAKQKGYKKITIDTYNALAGKSRNPIENIINKEANKIYEKVKNKEDIKTLFLEHLLKINIDKTITKKAIEANSLPQNLLNIAKRFIEARLFISSSKKDTTIIEIAHEALINSWDKLKGWISEEEEFLIFKTQLELFYQDWISDNKSKRALLKGLNLEKAIKYKDKINNSELLEFVRESEEEEKRQQEEKERQKRARRNFFLGSFGLVASAASFGWWKWREAEEAKKIADNRAKELERQKLLLQSEVEKANHNIGLALLQKANLALKDKKLAEANLFAYGALEKLSEKLDKSNAIAKAKSIIMNNKYVPIAYSKEVDIKNEKDLVEAIKNIPSKRFMKYIKYLLTQFEMEKKLQNQLHKKFKVKYQNIKDFSITTNLYAISTGDKIQIYKLKENKLWKEIVSIDKGTGFYSIEFFNNNLIAYAKVYYGNKTKNNIIIHSLKTNKKIIINNAHQDFISSLSFSPNGNFLASGALEDEGIIKIWDTNGTLLTTLDSNLKNISYVKFLDNKTLFSLSESYSNEKYSLSKITFWDISKIFNYDEINNAPETLYSILSNNDNLLFFLDSKKINIFDIRVNKVIQSIKYKEKIENAILSQNKKYLIILSSDYYIKIWNISPFYLIKKFSITKRDFDSIAITPNNQYLLAYNFAFSYCEVYDLNGNIINKIKRKVESENIIGIEPVLTKEYLIIWDKNKIKILNIKNGQMINELINDSQIKKLLIDSDEKELLVYDYNNKIKLFNIQRGNLIKEFLLPKYKYPIDSISLSKNKKIVCGYIDAKIKIFNYDGKFLMNLVDLSDEEISQRGDPAFYKILKLNKRRLISFYETLKIWTILDFSPKTIQTKIKELEQQLQAKLDGVTLKPTKIPYTKPLWSKYHPNYWLTIIEDSKALKKDKIKAMYQLGIIYDRDNQNQEALKWYKKAMEAGHKEAKKRYEFLTKWLKEHKKA